MGNLKGAVARGMYIIKIDEMFKNMNRAQLEARLTQMKSDRTMYEIGQDANVLKGDGELGADDEEMHVENDWFGNDW